MSYASIMVAVDGSPHVPARVQLAADLAHRFAARLVGVAACLPDYPQSYGETAAPMGMIIEEIRRATLDRLAGVERVFRQASCLNSRVEWRSDLAEPATFLERQSRAADLVVVGRPGDDEELRPGFAVDAGDAVMGLGRPVLVVPPDVEHLEARRIVVGWKNTPQTRRALSDAMPLLRRAEAVQVLRVGDGENQAEIEDVVRYLALHEIHASARQVSPSARTVADDLQAGAAEFGADLIVSGAYGYSRMREWFFGGVTRELLAKATVCCLTSH